MLCDVIDPVTKQRYDRDPRYIAKKAEMYLASTALADTAYFGAEAEFFIFDNIRFDQNEHSGFYFIDAEEGRWNSDAKRRTWAIAPLQRGILPRAAHRPLPRPAQRDGDDHAGVGLEVECTTTKSPPVARPKSTCASIRW